MQVRAFKDGLLVTDRRRLAIPSMIPVVLPAEAMARDAWHMQFSLSLMVVL